MCESDPVASAEVEQERVCSPRSMYSLATAVGVPYGYIALGADVLKAWDPHHQGGCTEGHPIETFSHKHRTRTVYFLRCKVGIHRFFRSFLHAWTSFSHQVVTDMEIRFLHENFTEKDPKLLMEHIQRMAAGKAPFFAPTLRLVYKKLIEKSFARPVPSGSGSGKSAEVESAADFYYSFQRSISIPSDSPTPTPGDAVATELTWLQCNRCRGIARLAELYGGMRCPQCPSKRGLKGPPLMQCSICRVMRIVRTDTCLEITCGARFR